MTRISPGIIFVALLVTLGCKPKRHVECPPLSQQIEVDLQIALVDDGRTEKLVRSLDRDALKASGISVLKETVSTGMQGKLVCYYMVRADDPAKGGMTGREILREGIDESLIPKGRVLGFARKPAPEVGGDLWRTHLLVHPPAILDEDVKSAVIEKDDQSGETVLRLTLEGEARESFGKLTAENVDRRIAIVVNNEVQTTLLIWEKNDAGELKIPVQALGHDEESRWQHACGLLR